MAGLHRASYGAGDAAAAAQQGPRRGEERRIAVLACGGVYESAALKIKKNNRANSGRGKEALVTGREGGKRGWRRGAGFAAGARGGREGVRRERCARGVPAPPPARSPQALWAVQQHQRMAQVRAVKGVVLC